MNEEQQPSAMRHPIRIKLPRKPAAPRHSPATVKAIALPNPSVREQTTNAVRFLFPSTLYPVVQMAIAMLLAATMLDEGESLQIVCYAVIAYLGGLALMIPRRGALTKTDEFVIRWGFLILCGVSAIVSSVIWPLRGY